MKNAIIFHGTDDSPDKYWYGWLAAELKKAGYEVSVPYYPEINHEPIADFLPKTLSKHHFGSETVLVGHSAGGPLILSILESVQVQIAQAILVAGYATHPDDQMEDPILQETYDWQKIKQSVKDIVFINSVDDPWNCNAEQGRIMFDKLGGTQVIRNDGHFGTDKFTPEQALYPTFPLVRALILGTNT